jgi:flagellar basal-body rod modification protein FlgD
VANITTTPISGTPVNGATGTPDNVTRTDAAGSYGQDTFLKLLMSEMQHQDPLAPTDSTQMMSQLAQFASVEGLNKLNSQITALNVAQDFASGVAMLGKSVSYLDASGNVQTGTVDGVKPSATGAQLSIGGIWIASGDIQQVGS